ncbi:hypothetical protein OAK12_00755 [Alphaproteobacteria bacterium]|nr:hypothetical protein [Alphaproteobacteria bacterium]
MIFDLNKILKKYSLGNKKVAYLELKKYLKKNKDISAHYNLAVMEQQLSYTDLAIKNYKSILKVSPNHLKSIINLYLIYLKKGDFEYAHNLINKAIIIENNNQDFIRDKSLVLYYLKKNDEALKYAKKAIELNPKDLLAINNFSLILMRSRKYLEAKKILEKGLALDKNNIYLINSMGRCCGYLNEKTNAISFYKRAIEIEPNAPEPINNLAGYFSDQGQYKKSIIYYKNAIKKDPKNIIINANIAKVYLHLNNDKLAESYLQFCLKLDQDNSMVRKTYSLLLLKKQQYKKAWGYFDGRLNLTDFSEKNSQVSIIKNYLWNGKKINKDDRILIIREQGVGDEILYGTIYPDLLKKFEYVTIEADKRLISLFSYSLKLNNNQKFVPLGSFSSNPKKIKLFQKVMYAGSLCKIFRNNLQDFNQIPYLKCPNTDPEIEDFLKKNTSKYKIGISWKSFQNTYGDSKSISLETLEPILRNKEISFINLQYGDVKNEIKRFLKNNSLIIKTFSNIDLFNDFNKISILLNKLDIFITVSNSTAHLAGALGIRTILIKPKSHATFHYWNQPNDKTPWYKSIKIISYVNNIDLIKKINDEIKKIKF